MRLLAVLFVLAVFGSVAVHSAATAGKLLADGTEIPVKNAVTPAENDDATTSASSTINPLDLAVEEEQKARLAEALNADSVPTAFLEEESQAQAQEAQPATSLSAVPKAAQAAVSDAVATAKAVAAKAGDDDDEENAGDESEDNADDEAEEDEDAEEDDDEEGDDDEDEAEFLEEDEDDDSDEEDAEDEDDESEDDDEAEDDEGADEAEDDEGADEEGAEFESEEMRFAQELPGVVVNGKIAGKEVKRVENPFTLKANGISILKTDAAANAANPLDAARGVSSLSNPKTGSNSSDCACVGRPNCACSLCPCAMAVGPCACRGPVNPNQIDPAKLTLVPKQSRTIILDDDHDDHLTASASSQSSSSFSTSSSSESKKVTFTSKSSDDPTFQQVTMLRANSIDQSTGETMLRPVMTCKSQPC